MGMNENRISGFVIGSGIVLVLFILLLGVVAPIFGFPIRNWLYHKYAVHSDYERRAKAEMVPVWIALWIWAVISWAILLMLA